jgi:TPR repeat protein
VKAIFMALILSALLAVPANARQLAIPPATNLMPTNSSADVLAIRAKAEKGDAEAQVLLGERYVWGNGVLQDFAEALKWFRKAADQDNALGQYCLGVSYDRGIVVPQDYQEAVKWYRIAADQGNADAQNNLGGCYDQGHGVTQDYVEAMKWYGKAADQGDAVAQCNLGNSYSQARGVTQDYVKAVKWYLKAANQGDAVAENNLGACYANGNGVIKDYVQAYKWHNLASAQGNELAKQFLPILEQRMTPEQIAEGQGLAREFKSNNATESAPLPPGNTPTDAIPKSSGTAFFITKDGFLVTAAHVLNGATRFRLLTHTGLIPARLVQLDIANDLSLLKADGLFSPLPITSSRAVKLGNTVSTIGFPNTGLQGFEPKLAKGEIASLSGVQDDPRYFQISVPCQPGNSGGALVDGRGNVIGVVAAKLNPATAFATTGALPENVNYAIKSSFLLGFLKSVPEVSAKLQDANTEDRKFEDIIDSLEKASVLVLTY